jgi:hypothetical protein
MEKVSDCDKPGNDLVANLQHGRTQSNNSAKKARITSVAV